MERQKHSRNSFHLFLGFSFLFIIAAYVNLFPPDRIISIIVFFTLVWVTSALFSLYFSGNTRRAVLVASGTAMYLLLRSFGLRHPLYGVLLIACIVAIEYLMRDR